MRWSWRSRRKDGLPLTSVPPPFAVRGVPPPRSELARIDRAARHENNDGNNDGAQRYEYQDPEEVHREVIVMAGLGP